ncbi:hypothetical protein [Lactobacillus corticis]|uniref:Uncharacterized protein n=1 Tax=Lactobacillus corticis TaxID=2201249 RepID=A0A916VJ44_9LACO|nr:hypothetical protein [Lactobacillus corticis]GFZ27014.1 hypothetical protein LCB40_08940 [Lactobacillus corticis]
MKKHLIFLGPTAVIYYSWLFMVLLLAIILAYEGNQAVVPSAIITSVIFLLLLAYTIWQSYYFETRRQLKLPYKKQLVVLKEPELIKQGRWFDRYSAQISHYQSIQYLVKRSKKSNK